ncbi:MAG: hypothetical protein IKD72_02640 [Clostridia bacterium]|nr:hypothetical protein [Clostridia bacterium]
MKTLVPILAALCAVLAAAIFVTVVLRSRSSPTPEETAAAAASSVSMQERTLPSDRPARTAAPQATETSAATTEAATTAADPSAWQAAYRAYLSSYESEDWIEPKFTLIYLDADDVPELAVCDGNYHAAQWNIRTYRDGLQEIGSFGGWGNFFYYERAATIYSSYGNHGAWTANVFRVENGAAVSVWEGRGDLDEAGNEIFFDANGNPITEAEYNAQMDTVLPAGAQEKQLSYDEDGWEITDTNIETYVR